MGKVQGDSQTLDFFIIKYDPIHLYLQCSQHWLLYNVYSSAHIPDRLNYALQVRESIYVFKEKDLPNG